MAESSLIKKLVIKPNNKVAIVNAPEGYRLENLPDGVQVSDQLDGEFDVIHAFYIKQADLEPQIPALKSHLKAGGILWVSYPKAGKLGTDLKRDPLYDLMLKHGVQANSQIAIDDTWSALRFKIVG